MRSLEKQASWFARIQLTLAGVIVIAGVAFYVVWYRPSTKQMRDLRSTLDTSNHNLEMSRNKADGLPSVTKAVADLRQDLATFDRQVPKHQDLPQFLETLETLKQQAGISKCSTKPDVIMSYASYSEQTIHVEFEGDFAPVADFLASMEALDRMTRIKHLTLKASPTDAGVVAVQMDVCIYFLEG
ncbi:MAG TPA: type 4a pilus biogenesis protein PilO [Tepidisphaeraceae bacterium]|jgi:Tfp pilus assembly protein PilO|nr:type 4a pilus biogenesis protein PilO [Tepidisphaeraceae bacterium]